MDLRFHTAQRLLSKGDVEGFRTQLVAEPELATARSSCDHPTLMQCLVLNLPVVDGLEKMIQILAELGSELTNPLIAAASVDNTRAISQLIDLGGSVEGNGNWSPLEEALYWGHAASVEMLLHRGAAVDNLRKAAGLGRMDVITACFDHDALTAQAGQLAWPFGNNIPLQVQTDRQQIIDNALIYAAAWGQIQIVDELMRRGANVNSIPAGFDFAGTPLHYAAFEGRREMVFHLLDLGANPAAVDAKIHLLPENWASYKGHDTLATVLRAKREGSQLSAN